MKRFIVMGALIACMGFLLATSAYARERDSRGTVSELKGELEKEAAFTPKELDPIERPLKNMLDKGATKEDLKNLLTDLAQKGIKGRELKNTIDSTNDLVNRGESPQEAGNVVSQAAHMAQAQGLKGKELAAKVHEAIQQRKAERERLKEREKREKEKQKEERSREKEKSKGKNR